MHACMYVCMYVRMCMYVCVHVCMCVYVCIYVYVCMFVVLHGPPSLLLAEREREIVWYTDMSDILFEETMMICTLCIY